MGAQFDRLFELQIGTTIIKEQDVQFKVTRSLKKKPNTAEITIYNLAETTRGAIAESAKQTVQITAGYRGRSESNAAVDAVSTADSSAGVLFLGDVREVHNSYFPPDWMTTVEAGDGERKIRTGRVNKSFAPGTNLATVLKETAQAMGVGLGNAAKKAIASGSLEGAGKEFLNGVTVSGPAYAELSRLAKSAGQEISIQNGVIQILPRNLPLTDVSVVLNSGTGLIGAPTVGDKGVIKFRALLNPAIVPGRQIELTSRGLSGRFRAVRCDYSGDTHGQDWYVDVEARKL